MKPPPYIIALLCLFLASCTIGGKRIALVNDRNDNGTYKPTKDVLHPITGESPRASGRIYVYPAGDVALSGSLSQPLNTRTLKLPR